MMAEFERTQMMQTTTIDMINNRIKQAKYKLSQHKTQGTNSRLSVFEVAKLMDTVKRGEQVNNNDANNLFFSLN
ncbi:MAG: hypothetical protein Crog4KO_01940 [Crocinitomicaceae bacterium]